MSRSGPNDNDGLQDQTPQGGDNPADAEEAVCKYNCIFTVQTVMIFASAAAAIFAISMGYMYNEVKW